MIKLEKLSQNVYIKSVFEENTTSLFFTNNLDGDKNIVYRSFLFLDDKKFLYETLLKKELTLSRNNHYNLIDIIDCCYDFALWEKDNFSFDGMLSACCRQCFNVPFIEILNAVSDEFSRIQSKNYEIIVAINN